MAAYIKKAERVEALQLTGTNHQEILDFVGKRYIRSSAVIEPALVIHFKWDETVMMWPGDYIVREELNEIYAVSNYTFNEKYKKEK